MLSLDDVYKFIDRFDRSGKKIASVAAQTGTGKSTMFPQGFFLRGKTIFVVQPTITASTGLAKYMKTRIPEDAIGTAVEGDIRYQNSDLYSYDDIKTPVVYCTAGHLRNILLRFGENPKTSSKFVDYIFLDEAHTGDILYDTIMYMYNYLLKKANNTKLPDLILITATPGVYPFSNNQIFEAKYPGKSYPVSITYHNRDYKVESNKEYKQLFTDVVDEVIRWHEASPLEADEIDSWLIFCPGKNEIIEVVDSLRNHTTGTIIIPLYSSMTEEDNIHYDYKPPGGIRKIIVSTNVAEASITIDGLTGVFDTLVEKTTIKGSSGATKLAIANIAKASAQQRKGRAGRTQEGFCHRMCTEKFFNQLIDVRLREIQRISPDGMILDLLSRQLKIKEIITDNAVPEKTLDEAIKRLTTIGLIDEESGSTTIAADWVKRIPLSPRNGMFFWLWSKYSEFNPYIGAVITAVMETHASSYFYIGEEDPPLEEVIRSKFMTVYNRFNKIKSNKSSLKFNILLILDIIETFKTVDINKYDLKIFCRNNNLNNQKISECFKLIKQLTGMFITKKRPLQIGTFDVGEAVDKASPHLFQCYADLAYIPDTSAKKYKLKFPEGDALKIDDSRFRNRIIPIGIFETEYRVFVTLYESIPVLPLAKVLPPISNRVMASSELDDLSE